MSKKKHKVLLHSLFFIEKIWFRLDYYIAQGLSETNFNKRFLEVRCVFAESIISRQLISRTSIIALIY